MLGHGGVENAQRVREEDVIEDVDTGIRPERERGADEVAEPIDGATRGVAERGDEERARQVRGVVLDLVDRRQRAVADCQGGGQWTAHVADASTIP